jgi:hypothetical protein
MFKGFQSNMVIIAYLGNNVNEYIDHYLSLLENMELYCEKHPSQRLAYHGTYWRNVKDAEIKIPVQRLICYKCKRAKMGATTSVLPDFLMPYKQFTTTEIKSVAKQSKAGKVPYDIDSKASISTIRRWLREISTQDGEHLASHSCIITTVPAEPLPGLPSAVHSLSPTSDEEKVSTVGYFDYGVWLIAPIEDLYSIAPLG